MTRRPKLRGWHRLWTPWEARCQLRPSKPGNNLGHSRQAKKEDDQKIGLLGPRNLQLKHLRYGKHQHDNIGHEIQASNGEGELAVGEAVHRDGDIPRSVLDVAEGDDGEEGDAVVDGAVDEHGVDDIAEFCLQFEDAQVEEEDRELDEVVGCGTGGKGSHDPLYGERKLPSLWDELRRCDD